VQVEEMNRDGVPDLVVGDGSVTVLYGIPR
jgi:hypothetical protein